MLAASDISFLPETHGILEFFLINLVHISVTGFLIFVLFSLRKSLCFEVTWWCDFRVVLCVEFDYVDQFDYSVVSDLKACCVSWGSRWFTPCLGSDAFTQIFFKYNVTALCTRAPQL
ncbi:hypothetical protein KFK09_027340 [Dendrobium nobile]|uniref:Uncharacterized protein n=1 Tax=Dendrobium nobile TaxID=94219 RepID=A0A8T3AAK3_DENNO|nr:hypothetical protein KFK09_027340 [Dendrobium nobile]